MGSKMKLIYLTYCLLNICIISAQESDQQIRLISELELIDWDLQDECTDISTSIKRFILGGPNGFTDKINIEETHYKYLKTQSKRLLKYEEDLPYELTRNWTFLTKPGDALLEENDIKSLVTFANNNLETTRTTKIACENVDENKECKLSKQDVLNEFSTNRNVTSLENIWTNWQSSINIKREVEYPSILKLVTKAAILNEKYDAKTYWETLSEYQEAYSKSEDMWAEIEPLYQKLYEFVRIRLNNYYQTDFDKIPAYLLGSNFGEDWSNIADIVLPHPQIYHDIQIQLQAKNIKSSYKYAENLTKTMGLGVLGKHFWTKSEFNFKKCGPEVLNYCAEKYSEVITCKENNIDNYLKSHEAAIEMLLNRNDYTSLPRQNLRYSTVTEAIINLGSLFGLNNIPYYGLLPADVFTNDINGPDHKLMFLLMTALRILPKLPYYLAVDKWRLEELENPTEDLNQSWWINRNKYQGIQISPQNEADYLEDAMISHNKPYISKFLGAILQFQLLNYYQMTLFQETSNLVKNLREDATFSGMIKDRGNRDIIDLIGYYYGFDEVSTYPLTEFFAPLEEYFENAPLTQSKFEIKTIKPETTTETITTPKIRRKKPKLEEHKPIDIPLNDQVVNNVTIIKSEKFLIKIKDKPIETNDSHESHDLHESHDSEKSLSHAGVYVGGGIVALTLIAILGVVLMKYVKKKNKSNNRRHDP